MMIIREMETLARFRWVVILVGITAFAACARDDGSKTKETNTAQSPEPEKIAPFIIIAREARCDTPEYASFVSNPAYKLKRDSTFVSAPYMAENEVHDCQKLISGDTLGSLVALLVDTLRVRTGEAANGVFADIMSYDAKPYPQLGITPNLNCLWILEGDEENGSDWKAAVRKPQGSSCMYEKFDSTPNTVALQVRRMKIPGGGEYPSTGRWMWDSIAHQQFIGIRCGDAWCEIGAQDFHTDTVLSGSAEIPGWYDEQFLTYVPTGGTLTLSHIFGRIEPMPGLGNRGQIHSSGGATVARLKFYGVDQPAMNAFGRKFDFDSTKMKTNLKFRIRVKAPGDTVFEFEGDKGLWPGKIRYNALTQHAGKRIVRWAWSDKDEMAWFPCEVGCCRTED